MSSGNKPFLNFYKIAYGLLFVVAFLGVLLRSSPFITLPLPYLHILHAHSHTALLGWAFVMACLGIITLFKTNYKHFTLHFMVLGISIIGMLFSFLYQSYGPISIGFSTLFILIAYTILFHIYKRLPKSLLGQMLKRSIIWFYISTIGIWLLGPTSALLGKEHWLYDTAIQFFLHFQINGWLLYAALGILLSILEKISPAEKQIVLRDPVALYALDIGLIFGLAPLAYWEIPNSSFLVINALSVLCLTYGLVKISYLIWQSSGHNVYLRKFIAVLIILNILSHIVSLRPNFLENLESNRNLLIAYIHLILLGIVSLTFVHYSIKQNIMPYDNYTKSAIIMWIIGFIFSEAYLMLQGLFQMNLPFYLEIIWFSSLLILVGIGLLFIKVLIKKKLPRIEQSFT